MFEIRTIKQVPKGFQPDYKDEGVPYLSQKTGGSYGVNGYVSKETEQCLELITNEMIVTGVDNVANGVMYWWDEPFFGNKLTGISNKHLNRLTAQYIITILLKMYIGNSYNNKISNKIIRETEIELPILSPEDTEPYWDYMAYFIHNIQQQYADQLEAKSEYELNLMCQILGVTREDIAQRVEFTQPQYTNKFTVDEIFDIKSTKKAIHKNTIADFNGEYPYVTRKEGGNGVDSYINEDTQYLNPGNTITLARDTYIFYYQKEPYFTGDKIKIITYEGINETNALYMVTLLNKKLGGMTWGQTMSMTELNKIELELPVLAANSKQIDWGAIRHVIVKKRQLSGYSSRDMQQGSCDNQTVDSVDLPQPIYKEFRLKDLFTSVKRGTRLVTSDRVPGNTPLITAGETNQGVSQYISHNNELFPANTLTIDMFGNVFYRGFEFFADDNIIVLNNPKLTRRVLNYLQSMLFWLTSNYSYAKQFRLKELDNLTLRLPVHTADDTIPNWGYMDDYIKEIELNYLVKKVIQAQRTIKQIRQII